LNLGQWNVTVSSVFWSSIFGDTTQDCSPFLNLEYDHGTGDNGQEQLTD
jgi:hypothetical protein